VKSLLAGDIFCYSLPTLNLTQINGHTRHAYTIRNPIRFVRVLGRGNCDGEAGSGDGHRLSASSSPQAGLKRGARCDEKGRSPVPHLLESHPLNANPTGMGGKRVDCGKCGRGDQKRCDCDEAGRTATNVFDREILFL